MIRRLLHLAREFWYAMGHAESTRESWSLFRQTCRFHFHNRRKEKTTRAELPFEVRLRIGAEPIPLKLRTFAGDLFVLYEIFLTRPYQIPASALAPDEVRLVFDCGANIGLTSLYLADRYPNALVLAVEPHPDNFALLQFNTAHQPRITPIQACVVGTESGQQYITVDRPAWGNAINADGDGVAVVGMTIDHLLEMHGYGQIDLLKIDIEGAERQLFENPAFLQRTRFAILELHGDYTADDLQRDVAPFRFHVWPADHQIKMVTIRPAACTAHQDVTN